jgi:hypothetical protein
MIEIFSEWVVVGACRVKYGSFNDRKRADEYASFMTSTRGLTCRVVHRDQLKSVSGAK